MSSVPAIMLLLQHVSTEDEGVKEVWDPWEIWRYITKDFRNGRHTPLMIIVRGGTLSDDSFTKLQQYMEEIKGEQGQHAFMVLETEETEKTLDIEDSKQPDVEIKDLAGILQTDGLFQEYQDKCRQKIQSAFLLPNLYVGYTNDFNRATAQVAMEVTEKQVFQPERLSLAWQINNKLLNGYGFQYAEAVFNAPDITNPEDITRILNITERAGGLTLNDARALSMETLGQEAENYPETLDMSDVGSLPLALIKSMPALSNYGYSPNAQASDSINGQVDAAIEKAEINHDDEIVSVMKEVRRLLIGGGQCANTADS